jgi:hypothetical protein
LAFLVLVFFAFKRKLRLFEPVTIFSIYYITIVPVALYLLLIDFRNSIVFDTTTFSNPTDKLFMMAMIYYVIGYISMVTGYYVIRTNRSVIINLNSKTIIPDILLTSTIFLFFFIGILNFAYNVQVISGGNVIGYMANTAGKNYEFEGKGITTLGYHFVWVALYVWFYKILRQGRTVTIPFLICALIGLVMKASTGRITSTLVFLGLFMLFITS